MTKHILLGRKLLTYTEAQQVLHDDYINRLVGKPAVVTFTADKYADCWLEAGLLVQPYHYVSYTGRLFDREAEIAWLKTLPEYRAYYWALTGRDRAIVCNCVKHPDIAFLWACNIGDHEIMRDRITESEWAYKWAQDIGDREVMRDRVTESKWAFKWARDIGDHEIMRDRITEPEWALNWARFIGDEGIMHKLVIGTEWETMWQLYIDNRDKLLSRREPE